MQGAFKGGGGARRPPYLILPRGRLLPPAAGSLSNGYGCDSWTVVAVTPQAHDVTGEHRFLLAYHPLDRIP